MSLLEEKLKQYLRDCEEGTLNTISFGWGDDIDKTTMGMEPENLILVGGANKAGKTTMAINTVASGLDVGARILVVTTEVTPMQYILRLSCRELNVSLRDIREGNLSKDRFKALNQVSRRYARDSNLHISGRGHCTAGDILSDIRESSPDAVIIDHLQRIDPESDGEALGYKYVSQKLKEAALQNGIPILVLSQVTFDKDFVELTDDGHCTYRLEKMSTRWSREPMGEGDKILFLHNLERMNRRYKGLMNVIFHSLRDYESGGYKTIRVDYNHQRVLEGYKAPQQIIDNSPFAESNGQ